MSQELGWRIGHSRLFRSKLANTHWRNDQIYCRSEYCRSSVHSASSTTGCYFLRKLCPSVVLQRRWLFYIISIWEILVLFFLFVKWIIISRILFLLLFCDIIKVGELEIAEMVQQITDAATKKLTSTAQILQFDKTSIREFYFPFN